MKAYYYSIVLVQAEPVLPLYGRNGTQGRDNILLLLLKQRHRAVQTL